MISALCKVQTVRFEKLATDFDCTAIRFFSYENTAVVVANLLDIDLVAKFIFRLLPRKQFRLAMDRTN